MQASQLLDQLMGRILWVDVPLQTAEPKKAERVERVFSYSLIFSGVRCILQYAILPFVLPLIGIASEAALPFMLLINVVAMISIFYSLRRFWQIRYKYRWQYLLVAVAAFMILTGFIVLDIQAISDL